ncbi:MAG: M18 family aminopeptidase [bacterium]|nr:M18 family aminopeptidase [bacterium]
MSGLKKAVEASTSPFHAVQYAEAYLAAKGFQELKLEETWKEKVKVGGSYFVTAFDTTLTAFTVGALEDGWQLRMAASHLDWPCVMVKPSPEVTTKRYAKLNVEVYGGPILNTWLDRPLSLAGRVCSKGKDAFHPQVHFVDFKRPILTIPNLAIHMNREVNKGVAINAQVDMLPLAALLTEKLDQDHFFLQLLAKEISVEPEDILDYEFCVYNMDEGCVCGFENEFFSAPRLDNITSVEACLYAITENAPSTGIRAVTLYHNEEIGSNTKQGANSPLTERILEKLYLALGYDREDFLNGLMNGLLLSLDVAHAIHPNHPEKCDIKNQIFMNDGVAIKQASAQSYATDAVADSVVEALCRENGIPYKKFSNRSDVKGGSTLGRISSSLLNMRTIDAGAPILAMHSARELMGVRDQWALNELTKAFLA